MRRGFATVLVVALAGAFPSGSAWGWQTGEDYDQPLMCKRISLGGADSLVVRVRPTDGSFGIPRLVGLKDGEVLWGRTFPRASEVNVAKLDAFCEGRSIVIRSEFPGSTNAVLQRFVWNGRRLTKVKEWPSTR